MFGTFPDAKSSAGAVNKNSMPDLAKDFPGIFDAVLTEIKGFKGAK